MTGPHTPSCEVLAERIKDVVRDVNDLKSARVERDKEFRDLMVELKTLQVRVSLYAALVAGGVSLLFKFLV